MENAGTLSAVEWWTGMRTIRTIDMEVFGRINDDKSSAVRHNADNALVVEHLSTIESCDNYACLCRVDAGKYIFVGSL